MARRLLQKMHIFVRTVRVTTIELEVERLTTIRELKAEIQSKEGIPIDRQTLLFRGLQLEDGRSLSSYHVEEESTLDLFSPFPKKMRVAYYTEKGERFILDISRGDTFERVQMLVQEKAGVPFHQQRLKLRLVKSGNRNHRREETNRWPKIPAGEPFCDESDLGINDPKRRFALYIQKIAGYLPFFRVPE